MYTNLESRGWLNLTTGLSLTSGEYDGLEMMWLLKLSWLSPLLLEVNCCVWESEDVSDVFGRQSLLENQIVYLVSRTVYLYPQNETVYHEFHENLKFCHVLFHEKKDFLILAGSVFCH